MHDVDVRSALHERLRADHATALSDTLFVDELGLCGEARVDVAVVDGFLSGYELKSASDTLRRLPAQVQVYSRVLDYAVLVVAENHHDDAVALLPDWWGRISVSWDGTSAHLVSRALPKRNPNIDKESLAWLLWRDEALEALTERGLDQGVRSKNRRTLIGRLAERLDLDELRDVVRLKLKTRTRWRGERPQLATQ